MQNPFSMYFEKQGIPSLERYRSLSNLDKKVLRKAFDFCLKNGSPPRKNFVRSMEAWELLAELKSDVPTIVLGMLAPFFYDSRLRLNIPDFCRDLGLDIETQKALKSVQYLQGILSQNVGKNHTYLQKVMIAQSADFRVLLVLLAQRVLRMRHLGDDQSDLEIIRYICEETMGVQIPLSSRLGLYNFKSELEDMALKYLHPKHYRNIARQIGHKKREREAFLSHAIAEIEDVLSSHNVEFVEVSGRIKNIYSIYKKIKTKRYTDLSDVFDLIALRIIVPDKNTCYQTLGVIHARWAPLYQRFKDYIAVPKTNGYQSIHTTVLGLAHRKLPTEIQIRTEEMHRESEYGMAAHWAYKGINSFSDKSAYMPSFTEVVEQEHFQSQFSQLSDSLKKSRMVVFTPQGDIKHLPKGATPVDFAYAVHSDVGNICAGAKVNGLIRPLDFELKKGDVVEILTKKGREPNPDWLSFVLTSHAKGHIKRFINRKKAALDKEIAEIKDPSAGMLAKKVPASNDTGKPRTPEKAALSSEEKMQVIIGGEKDLPYRLATCCAPVLGQDEIIAVSNRGLSFVIHRRTCEHLPDGASDHVMDAYCLMTKVFKTETHDRVGIMADAAYFFQEHRVNVLDFSVRTEGNRAYQRFSVQVHSEQEFWDLLDKLKQRLKVDSVTELD